MALVEYNSKDYPGIMIDDPGGAATFRLTVQEALDRIVSRPKGKKMLQEICSKCPVFTAWGGKVKIYRAAQRTVDSKNPGAEGGSKCAPVNEINACNGTGAASGVSWNCNVWTVPGQGVRPPFIGLAHELVHAWHCAKGTKKSSYDDEESFTVGLGTYATSGLDDITENIIRAEHGIGARTKY